MKTFNVTPIIGDNERTFDIQEESTANTYIVKENQKFLARVFREPDGRWKTVEVSDLSPADVNTIGEEIDLYLGDEKG